MKKSMRYHIATLAVLNWNDVSDEDKLEIIDTLMSDQRLAEWTEKAEEEKKREEENW